MSPAAVTLSSSGGGAYTGTFTITASGGSVSYSITDPAPTGDLIISNTSGTLAAGQQITITVSVANNAGLTYETDLTLDPGPLMVAVDYPPGNTPG